MPVDEGQKIRLLPLHVGPVGTDRVVIEKYTNAAASNTMVVEVRELFGNSQANLVVGNSYHLVIGRGATPANSTNYSGPAQSVWGDGTYIYYSSNTTHVKRTAALADF